MLCEYRECFPRTLCNKGQGSGLLLQQLCSLGCKCPAFLQVQPGIYQLTSSRSWEQPQLSFPPALSTHFLLPYLILQLLSLGAPWAAAASPSVLSVLSAVHAAKPQRKQEWKRKKPVAQEWCSGRDVLCPAPGDSGGEPGMGAGLVMRVRSCQDASGCRKAMERLQWLLFPPNTSNPWALQPLL